MTAEALAAGASDAGRAGGRTEVTLYGPEYHATGGLELLDEPTDPRVTVRWVHLDRRDDHGALAEIACRFSIHPLALEDVVSGHQRSKAEAFTAAGAPTACRGGLASPDVFVMIRLAHLEGRTLCSDQVSVFVGDGVVLTVGDESGHDVFDQVRQRLTRVDTRVRGLGADYLAYALLDAVVDALFPVIEKVFVRIEEMDAAIDEDPNAEVIAMVRKLRHDLMQMRREQVAVRTLLGELQVGDYPQVGEEARLYLRDVEDHSVRAVDLIDSALDGTRALADAWANAINLRTNEVMKVLTLVAALFIPLSFMAGVFGMNFDSVPLLHNPAGFWGFMLLCLACALAMVAWFRWNRWI